ncbi:hypothetical protein [Streptomyces sp. NPDC050121]|uniref:hypothetical protein n=1 Tax=Streptomyces sp. NPDC050121 TaxID=3365601 RepID=UPI00378BC3E3
MPEPTHITAAHSSRRIRVEHGIAHLKNGRALARHHGRREHMSDIIQAVAALLSHRQTVWIEPLVRVPADELLGEFRSSTTARNAYRKA